MEGQRRISAGPTYRRLRSVLTGATVVGCLAATACGAERHIPDAGWPHWGNSAENTRFAELDQINAANVSRLKLAWERSEGGAQTSWETFPVVVGSTMYYTTGTDQVIAVDARTGRQRWSYLPRVNFQPSPETATTMPVNRGVAVGAGRVYELTYDDQLIALDASTGRRLWRVRAANAAAGYTANSPGVYWRGEIIVGGPAGDAQLDGFMAAFSARTGRPLWRARMPGPPARGGHVWMPPVVDPRSGVVYASVGNPAPAFRARDGCAQTADATVALDARTGRVQWVHHELCADAWDYDTAQAPVILDLRGRGRAMTAVGAASKAGFYSTLDARTGALIARTQELVRYSEPHRDPSGHGTVLCPGIFGGLEYGPPSYDPGLGSLFLATTTSCMRYRLARAARGLTVPQESGLGGTATPVGKATGGVVAINPASGAVRWRAALPKPAVGGTLATAGGLVFAGDDNGTLYAFAERTGKVLWRRRLGLRFGSAPIAYQLNGVEYVAVVDGGSEVAPDGAPGGGELRVFRLP